MRGDERKVLHIETVALEPMEFEYAACGGTQGAVPVAIGGSGKAKLRPQQRLNSCVGFNVKSQDSFRRLCRLQGLPEDFDLPPFTVAAKCKAVGNGVPMAMGRALARAVRAALVAAPG